MNKHNTLLLFISLFFPLAGLCQVEAVFWEKTPDKERYLLDESAFRAYLSKAPQEKDLHGLRAALLLFFPNTEGELVPFKIYETSIFEEMPDKSFAEYKTYSGVGVNDLSLRLKMEVMPGRIGVFILKNGGQSWFVEPLGEGQYRAMVKMVDSLEKACFTPESDRPRSRVKNKGQFAGELLIYRLALTASGEYTDFWGSRDATIEAMITTVNRINAILERDLAVRLQLIDDLRFLIFQDPNTDPFELNGNQNVQNQQFLDRNIGEDEYDIGHVLLIDDVPSGFGSVGSACVSGRKGSGYTILPDPSDYSLLIDFLAHELGHQLGGNHTFSHCGDSNPGLLPFEPGSGSTIMAYGGLPFCEDDNFVEHSSDYFHSASIEEIHQFTRAGEGAGCSVVVNFPNKPPQIKLAGTTLFLPQQTPFELTASAIDAEGDTLSYCWEQMNAAVQYPLGEIGQGSPLFRSRPPSEGGRRVFPALSAILESRTFPEEQLPDFTGLLDFRLTVRDQHFRGGGVAWEELQINVTDQAGPFRVITASDPEVWPAGSDQWVLWEVAATDQPPVEVKEVDIYLMLDSLGEELIHLAGPVPNTGEAVVQLPVNVPTGPAWIKIKGHNALFFDLSDSPVELQAPATSAVELNQEDVLDIFPNPAKDRLFVSKKEGWISEVSVKLIDSWGRELWKKEVGTTGEVLVLDLPANLTEGLIQVQLNYLDKDRWRSMTRRVFITK